MREKIFVFGATGSGKTTFAKELSKKLNIPFYTTDKLIYKGKSWDKKYTEKQRDKKLLDIAKKKKWIIEGVHRGDWILPAFRKANFVIILSLPRYILLKRTIFRYIKRKIKIDKEKDDFKGTLLSLKYAWIYKNGNFVHHKNMVKKYKKDCIILKNKREIKNFLNRQVIPK